MSLWTPKYLSLGPSCWSYLNLHLSQDFLLGLLFFSLSTLYTILCSLWRHPIDEVTMSPDPACIEHFQQSTGLLQLGILQPSQVNLSIFKTVSLFQHPNPALLCFE